MGTATFTAPPDGAARPVLAAPVRAAAPSLRLRREPKFEFHALAPRDAPPPGFSNVANGPSGQSRVLDLLLAVEAFGEAVLRRTPPRVCNYSGQRALIVVECLCGFRVHTPEASTRSGILRRGLQRYE